MAKSKTPVKTPVVEAKPPEREVVSVAIRNYFKRREAGYELVDKRHHEIISRNEFVGDVVNMYRPSK